jgi:hypothetical protein
MDQALDLVLLDLAHPDLGHLDLDQVLTMGLALDLVRALAADLASEPVLFLQLLPSSSQSPPLSLPPSSQLLFPHLPLLDLPVLVVPAKAALIRAARALVLWVHRLSLLVLAPSPGLPLAFQRPVPPSGLLITSPLHCLPLQAKHLPVSSLTLSSLQEVTILPTPTLAVIRRPLLSLNRDLVDQEMAALAVTLAEPAHHMSSLLRRNRMEALMVTLATQILVQVLLLDPPLLLPRLSRLVVQGMGVQATAARITAALATAVRETASRQALHTKPEIILSQYLHSLLLLLFQMLAAAWSTPLLQVGSHLRVLMALVVKAAHPSFPL